MSNVLVILEEGGRKIGKRALWRVPCVGELVLAERLYEVTRVTHLPARADAGLGQDAALCAVRTVEQQAVDAGTDPDELEAQLIAGEIRPERLQQVTDAWRELALARGDEIRFGVKPGPARARSVRATRALLAMGIDPTTGKAP